MTRNEMLKDAYTLFNTRYQFKPGDIVRWKPGMKYKRSDGPFIVVEVLETPVLDEMTRDGGSAYFRDRLDIILGSIDGEGDFICYHYDSRRLEPVGE